MDKSGEPIPNKRRHSFESGSADEQAVQVVGFHVEGEEEESHASSNSSLLGGHANRGSNSPLPVTIPPAFRANRASTNLLPPSLDDRLDAMSLPTRGPSGSRIGAKTSELTRQITPRREDNVVTPSLKPIQTGKGSATKEVGLKQEKDVGEDASSSKAVTPDVDGKGKGKKGGKGGGKEAKEGGKEKQKQGKKGQQQGSSGKAGKEKPAAGKDLPTSASSTSSKSLFDHLQQYKKIATQDLLRRPDVWDLNPCVVKLGVEYIEGHKTGGLLRCRAMLDAFRVLTSEFKPPGGGAFEPMDFLPTLNHHIGFLVDCRPLNVSMKNAIRYLKVEISKLPSGVPVSEGIESILRLIDNYKMERINVGRIIAREASQKIRDGDTILTYSPSQAVMEVFLHAWDVQQKQFKVIVVESRPKLVGRKVVSKLVGSGIPCTYVYINAISFVMKEVNTVFMGASAILMNGTVVARVGSAAVGMVAHACNVPVVICAETCKFHEQVQLNSFTQNELGDPYELEKGAGCTVSSSLAGWSKSGKLDLLNLKYDVMPAEYVAMIATEVGIMPTTSVPVILRETAIDSKAKN